MAVNVTHVCECRVLFVGIKNYCMEIHLQSMNSTLALHLRPPHLHVDPISNCGGMAGNKHFYAHCTRALPSTKTSTASFESNHKFMYIKLITIQNVSWMEKCCKIKLCHSSLFVSDLRFTGCSEGVCCQRNCLTLLRLSVYLLAW